jgi:four helix bundle protein
MSSRIESYRDLLVWQHSVDLVVAVYSLTRAFPKEELFGLTSQVRRSATSIPANIAEGYGRQNTGSYRQFLKIAQGSLKELETHLIVAERVGLAAGDEIVPLLRRSDDIGKMLGQLIRKIGPE